MDYNLLINGIYWGYNQLANHLLTSWDIQEEEIVLVGDMTFKGHFPEKWWVGETILSFWNGHFSGTTVAGRKSLDSKKKWIPFFR